jgi:energy-coupling factor transport system ATP-binding protein
MIALSAKSFSCFLDTGKPVFENICLDLMEGEACVVNGIAGTERTMLGYALSGFIPTIVPGVLSGEITHYSPTGQRVSEDKLDEQVGYVPTIVETHFFRSSVYEELLLSLRLTNYSFQDASEAVTSILEDFQLLGIADRDPNSLSGGQKRLILILATLLKNPHLLVIDGAFGGLDGNFRQKTATALDRFRKNGNSLIALGSVFDTDQIRATKNLSLKAFERKFSYESKDRTLTRNEGRRKEGQFLLQFENVSYSYGNVPVLKNINFDVRRGERIGIMGPNGAGKTTLSRLIMGYLAPLVGKIETQGIEGNRLSSFVVMQNPDLQFFFKTLDEELDALRISPKQKDLFRAAFGTLDQSPWALSAADRQLFLCYLSAYSQRDVIFLDEPNSRISESDFCNFAEHIKNLGTDSTFIVASHDPVAIALICDRIIIFQNNHIVADGSSNTILRDENLMKRMEIHLPKELHEIIRGTELSSTSLREYLVGQAAANRQ